MNWWNTELLNEHKPVWTVFVTNCTVTMWEKITQYVYSAHLHFILLWDGDLISHVSVFCRVFRVGCSRISRIKLVQTTYSPATCPSNMSQLLHVVPQQNPDHMRSVTVPAESTRLLNHLICSDSTSRHIWNMTLCVCRWRGSWIPEGLAVVGGPVNQ